MKKAMLKNAEMQGIYINFRPLFLVALGICTGIFIATVLSLVTSVVSATVILIALITAAIFKRKTFFCIALGILLGMLRLFIALPHDISFNSDIQNVEGKVYSSKETSVVLTNVTADGIDIKGRLLIMGNGLNVSIDDQVQFSAPLYISHKSENSSYGNYLLSEHVTAFTYLNEIKDFKSYKGRSSINGLLCRTRELIENKINALYGEEAAPVKGIVLGEKGEFDYAVTAGMRKSGIMHIFALSGLHISVLAGALTYVLKLIGCGGRRSIVTAFLIFYCAVTGFPVSLMRAAIMFIIMNVVTYWNGRYDNLSSCSLAAAIILLANPYQLFTAGFMLSFCAVLGILMLTEPIINVLSDRIFYSIRSAIAVSASASLGTAAPLATYFGSMPLYSIPINIVAVPIASIAVITAFLSIILGMLWEILAVPFVLITKLLLKCVVLLSLAVSELIYAQIPIGNVALLCGILWMTALYASSKFVIAKQRYKLMVSATLISYSILIFVLL